VLGLYRTHGKRHWFLCWVASWFGLASCLVAVLTFGFWNADWEIRWLIFLNRRKKGESAHKWIFNDRGMIMKSSRFLFWLGCWTWFPCMVPRLFDAVLGVVSLGYLRFDTREEWLWNAETQREEKIKQLPIRRVFEGGFTWWTYSCLMLMDELLGIASAVLGIVSFGYIDRVWRVNWLWDRRTRKHQKARDKRKEKKCLESEKSTPRT